MYQTVFALSMKHEEYIYVKLDYISFVPFYAKIKIKIVI
jgi:hypothetical protein